MTTDSDLQAQLVELETKLAFQDQTIEVLNDIVIHQQRQIDVLFQEVQTLKDRLQTATPSPVGPLEDEKPPHY